MAATLGFEHIHLDEAQCSIDAVRTNPLASAIEEDLPR
jgi:hypothetical protein